MKAKYAVLILLFFLYQSLFSQNVDTLLNDVRKKYNIPMLAVASLKSDTVLFMKAYGFRKLEDSIENASVNDFLHIASNAKAMTGFVAAKLVEQGKLNWSTQFFDLYPELQKNARKEYWSMTLQDLLSHRSLIRPYTSGEEYEKAKKEIALEGSPSEKRLQFMKYALTNQPVAVTDSLKWVYSNAGYAAASLMLEKVSGKAWEDLMIETFKQELGLNLAFKWPNQINDCQPWGYTMENGRLRPLLPTTVYNLELGEPAGHVSMPIKDYVKFIQMNLMGLNGKDNYLNKESYEFLHFGIPSYSIGWANRGNGEKLISEHKGTAGFFFCYAILFPRMNVAYIMMTNSGESESSFDVLSILRKYFK